MSTRYDLYEYGAGERERERREERSVCIMSYRMICHAVVFMLCLGVRAAAAAVEEVVNERSAFDGARLGPEEDETTTRVGRSMTAAAQVGRVSTRVGATTRIGRTSGSSIVRGVTSRGEGNMQPIFARVGAASPEKESWLELSESGKGDSTCVQSMARVESSVLLCARVTLTESVLFAANNGTVIVGCGAETEDGMCVVRRHAELSAPALVIGESTREVFFSNIRFEDDSSTATFFMEAEHAPKLTFENVRWDSKAGFALGKEDESLVLSLALSMLPFGVPVSFGNDTADKEKDEGVLPYALDGPSPRMLLFAQVLVIPDSILAAGDQSPVPSNEDVIASLHIAADSSMDTVEKENAALMCTLDGDATSERAFSLNVPTSTKRYHIAIVGESPSRKHDLICETVV